MTYRDDREALRAQVAALQQDLEQAKEAAEEIVLFPKKTPRQRRIQAGIVAGVIVAVAAAGAGIREAWKRAADREIAFAWGHLSTCLIGEPLGAAETVDARTRRIRLAAVAVSPRVGGGRWPLRCQAPAHQLYARLRENGRAEEGARDAAYWAETLATQMEHGARDDELLALLDPLWKQIAAAGIVASPSAGDIAPATPASPLHLADLAGAVVTSVDTPASSLYGDVFPGLDRHVLIDDAHVDPAVLCTLTAQSEVVVCRPLPGELGHKRGLRLLGTTDAGAAPLVFAGREGGDGIFRSDTGELVAQERALSGYAAADGYVAIHSWPATSDGSFDLIEQRKPRAEVTRTAVKPEALREIQPNTSIHRSQVLWDKALVQMVDQRHFDTSPWVAFRTLPGEGGARAFHRIADLNWINTTITGCRGARGMVARFGPSDAVLLFNDGDRWQGPLPARDLGELRCDGADAVFLSPWPVRVKRCTPAGCDDQSPEDGAWPTQPGRGMSASDLLDGKVVAAWATERLGVRVRVASAAQIGTASDVVVFDDMVAAGGEPARGSVISGMRLVAAGRAAALFLATDGGVRAILIGPDGSFAPAKIER